MERRAVDAIVRGCPAVAIPDIRARSSSSATTRRSSPSTLFVAIACAPAARRPAISAARGAAPALTDAVFKARGERQEARQHD